MTQLIMHAPVIYETAVVVRECILARAEPMPILLSEQCHS